MKIHFDLILFSIHENTAFFLFKGAEIKINSVLFDERLTQFIKYYQANDISINYPKCSLFTEDEISKLITLFIKLKLTTAKSKTIDENYLSNLDENCSFDFRQIKNNIVWFSLLNESINKKIAENFKYVRVNSIDSLNLSHFCIIFSDPYNRKSLSELAISLQEKKCNFLLVSIDYLKFTLGPLVTPFSNFCLQCLIARKDQNQADDTHRDKFEGTAFAEQYELPTFFISIICNYVQSELIKFLTADKSDLTSGVFDIGLYQPSASFSYLLPMPNCTVCT